MKKLIYFLNLVVLSFITVFLPFYFYCENESISPIRNVYFLLSIVLSIILIFLFFLENYRNNSSFIFFSYLITIFFSWTFVNLIVALVNFSIPNSDSDIIMLLYCFFSFAFGLRFIQFYHKKYFIFFTSIVWLVICYFVVSKIDFQYLQSIYGTENPKFFGVYQYIGDTFAFVSIALVTRIMAQNKLSGLMDYSQKQIKSNHAFQIFVTVLIIIVSIIILFFNSSRASFVCFIAVTPYMLYYLFSQLKMRKFVIFSIFICALCLTLYLAAINNFISIGSDLNLFTNRNLQAVETGSDGSWDERVQFYQLGLQDVIDNPIFGNYSTRVIDRGPGTYIHNLLAALQDFGIPSFLSYLSLVFLCVKQSFISKKLTINSEDIFLNSLLIFSIIQILFFRHPLGFYAIFVNFGMALNNFSQRSVDFQRQI